MTGQDPADIVSPADLDTFCAVSIGLASAAILVSFVPARRTTAVAPIEALRAD